MRTTDALDIKVSGLRRNSSLCGWFLVEAQLDRRSGLDRVCLRAQRLSNADDIFEIILPVSVSGKINELFWLPGDVTGLVWHGTATENLNQPLMYIRRIGWFERTWLMTNRVIRTYMRLSLRQRVRVGLSLWKVISDLAGSYSISSQFRLSPTYSQWIELCDLLSDEDEQKICQHIASFVNAPHFHLLLNVDRASCGAVHATLESLKKQAFQNFTCAVLDVDGVCSSLFGYEMELKDVGLNSCIVAQPHVAAWLDRLNRALAKQGEWVMLLRPGDILPVHSLYWFACESLAQPRAAVLYSDDDECNGERLREKPRFKPDWSLTYLRATNFIGNAVVLRGNEVAGAGGVRFDCCQHGSYDLLLRVIDEMGNEGEDSVTHIPAVLLHHSSSHVVRGSNCKKESVSQWCISALRVHLVRNHVMAEISETLPGCRRVRYYLPEVPPSVSIIVPSRNQLTLIRQCIESLLSKTKYSKFEILVVDNQSTDPDTLNYLAQIAEKNGIRVLRYDQPFNYSAINNFAVQEARGEVLCLLNNDTEVISSDWLEEMVGQLLQPKVGVVGAKLYFPDGHVQHAGDTVGPGGTANHLHSFIEKNDPGYCNRAMVMQELSAVTGACMVVWKSLYERMQGLDEKHLPVAFNDVDFCLRVREAGYRVVWTPHAELYHHESVSRGKDQSPEKIRRAKREVAYMRRRWKRVRRNDPFYNPNLSYERPDFSLSNAPMVTKPWQI